jgi:endonuclease/exonuclease/phosphatase family metal-dependent hydrolase
MRNNPFGLPSSARSSSVPASTHRSSSLWRPAGAAAAMLALALSTVPAANFAAATPLPAGPLPTVAAASANRLVRIATFNVRTARATSDDRTWLQRAPDVANEILTRKAHIVLLQELGPGRADGKTGTLNGHIRQTDSLMSALVKKGGGRYRLVRATPYFAPGTKHATQGARILYDSNVVKLVTNCPEKTGTRSYNTSCNFDLPIAAGDSREKLRSAAYAEFADRRNGHRFFVVSAHLDSRHSGNNTTEAKYNNLRAAQARAVADRLAKVNPQKRPVVFGGDLNSWRQDRGNFAPHRALVAKGYSDTSIAKTRINWAYSTVNHYETTMKPSKNKAGGVRLDVVMAKGAKGTTRLENKMTRVDRTRPSDHNMVLADILL